MSGAHPHSSVNVLLARLSSLIHHFRPDNGEPKLPQPLRPSVIHIHALLTCLSALIHSSPPENGESNELQQPSTPMRVDPCVLLARLFSFSHRSQLNIDEEAESHHTPPLSSRPDVLITRLSSLFRSQHTNEETELTQCTSRPRVVDVAAVRDRQALVVARGPQFEKAKRAYEQQVQSHAQAQASSSHTQPAGAASTSATHPAPGTAAAQSPPIPWWAHIVLFLCCTSPHANGR